MFSELSGMHIMKWAPEAQKACVTGFADEIRTSFENLGANVDAGKLSEDKTESSQLLSTLELEEKVL